MSEPPMFFDTATGKPVDLAAEMVAKSREVAGVQGQAIEALIRVYIEQAGLSVDEIELVERRESGAMAS